MKSIDPSVKIDEPNQYRNLAPNNVNKLVLYQSVKSFHIQIKYIDRIEFYPVRF